MTLDKLKCGQVLTVKEITIDGLGRQRFLDMGIINGVSVILKRIAPLGDPLIVEINRFEVAIRRIDARHIVGEIL